MFSVSKVFQKRKVTLSNHPYSSCFGLVKVFFRFCKLHGKMMKNACICSRVLLVCACSIPVFLLCSTSTSSTSSSVAFCCWQGCPLLRLLLLQCSCCTLPGLCFPCVASVPALSSLASCAPHTLLISLRLIKRKKIELSSRSGAPC